METCRAFQARNCPNAVLSPKFIAFCQTTQLRSLHCQVVSTTTSSSSRGVVCETSTTTGCASPRLPPIAPGCKKLDFRSTISVAATQGGLGDDDLDVAVFRFTLGIPGFDDSNIPRVIGAAIALLVAVNHALGANPAPPAQVRAEFLDITLAALCFVAPEIEQRLRQVGPGKGRAGAGLVQGSAQVFALDGSLAEGAKKELAWSSFALLKNVNCCSVLLLQSATGQALLARGAVASSCVTQGDNSASLSSISQALGRSSSGLLQGSQQQQWLPDRTAMQQSGILSCSCIPEGVQSAFVQAVSQHKVLVVLAERPRALSEKDRKWVSAIAAKLGDALQS